MQSAGSGAVTCAESVEGERRTRGREDGEGLEEGNLG